MSKNLDKSSGVIKNHSSASWFLLFFSLALFIFFFRGFLFNEYGGVTNSIVGAIIPFLVLMLTLFVTSISPVFFRMISLELNGEIGSSGITDLLKKTLRNYRKDLYIFYFFILFFIIVTAIRSESDSYKVYSPSVVLTGNILRYAIICGIIIILIFVSLKTIDIFHSTKKNIHYTKGNSVGQVIKCCLGLESFKFLIFTYFIFIYFISFLSDLFARSTNSDMGGLYIFMFLVVVIIFITALLYLGMLIASRGIKKNIITNFAFLLISFMVITVYSFVSYRILWINLYL